MKRFILTILVACWTISLSHGQQQPTPQPPPPTVPPPRPQRDAVPQQHSLPQAPPPTVTPNFRTRLSTVVGAATGPGEVVPTFDLSFSGGSARELVKAIEKATGELPSVIIPSKAPEVTFPPMELRRVTLTDVFNSLNLLGQSSGEGWTWQAGPRNQGVSGSAIWVLLTPPRPTTPSPVPNPYAFLQQQPTPPPETRVFNVGKLLEKFKIEDLTTAIQTGWAMAAKHRPSDAGDPEPELKFHKDTQLLLAYGTAKQIALANNVLMELQSALKTEATPPASPEKKEPKK